MNKFFFNPFKFNQKNYINNTIYNMKKYKKIFSINNDLGYRNYTVRDIINLKGKKKLTQIMVSNADEAAAAQEAGIDLLITRPTNELQKIRDAASKTFMTVGIPFINYSSRADIMKKAFEVIEIGADSLMCSCWNLNWMKDLSDFKIPFQGHAGFVPRRTTWIGDIRAYGKTSKEAQNLLNDIKNIENTGAWGVEIECVPEQVSGLISKSTSLVTLSIGSGKECDIQFLFAEDILGFSSIGKPKHVKNYRNFQKILDNMQKERITAFKEFKKDVVLKKFPGKKHSVKIDVNELNSFKKFINRIKKENK